MNPSLRFLLPCLVAGVIAGCGSSGGQTSMPAGTTTVPMSATDPSQSVQPAGDTAQTQSVATSAATPAPVPSGTYWSGTVSAISGSSLSANCGQSNFAQGYGCIPVSTAGAKITGTPVVGQFFQLWGDLSKLPNVTAGTIVYGATKFPTTARRLDRDRHQRVVRPRRLVRRQRRYRSPAAHRQRS